MHQSLSVWRSNLRIPQHQGERQCSNPEIRAKHVPQPFANPGVRLGSEVGVEGQGDKRVIRRAQVPLLREGFSRSLPERRWRTFYSPKDQDEKQFFAKSSIMDSRDKTNCELFHRVGRRLSCGEFAGPWVSVRGEAHSRL